MVEVVEAMKDSCTQTKSNQRNRRVVDGTHTSRVEQTVYNLMYGRISRYEMPLGHNSLDTAVI